MDNYVTAATIRSLRESKGLTQAELAALVGVSDKAVSKWETAKGLPDISLLEPLAGALGVSVAELLSGQPIVNKNVSGNMLRTGIYVCPVCGNVIHAIGSALISCCGITLPRLSAEEVDEEHKISIEAVEDEHFLTVRHDMTKEHYISFICHITSDRVQFVKLYPEGNAETRFKTSRVKWLYWYCSRHGLFRMHVRSLMK